MSYFRREKMNIKDIKSKGKLVDKANVIKRTKTKIMGSTGNRPFKKSIAKYYKKRPSKTAFSKYYSKLKLKL
jgi:hypothetical protein